MARSEETKAKQREATKRAWAEGRYRNTDFGRSRQAESMREFLSSLSQEERGKWFAARTGSDSAAAKTSETGLRRLMSANWVDLKGHAARKRRVVIEQEGRCAGCGISTWRDRPIVFELEHKDGDNRNNSRENLEGLCPNCHSQTPTWRGRGAAAAHKNISDEELLKALFTHGTYCGALRSLGLNAGGSNFKRLKGLVAQSAERSARIREVDGSTPSESSK